MIQRLQVSKRALAVVLPDGVPRILWAAMVAMTVGVVIGLVAPYLVKVTIDQVILARSRDLLWWIGVGGVVLYAVRAWCQWAERWWLSRLEEQLHRQIRARLFERVMALDLGHHKRLTPGYLLSRVEADTAEVSALLTQVMPGLWQVGFQIGATALVLMWLAPRLTLMAVLPMPIFAILAYWFDRRVRPKTRARLARRSVLYATLSEIFDGIEAVLVYNGQDVVRARLDERAVAVEEIGLSLGRDRAVLFPILDFAIAVVLLAVLVVGGHLVLSDSMSIGVMAAYYVYLARTLSPVRAMPGIVFGWHRAQAALLRTSQLLGTDTTLRDPKAPVALASGHHTLHLRAVGFEYTLGDETHRALDEITLHIAPGERVGVLGPSGAGKSTLGRLIARLMDPTEGQILWGDVDLKHVLLKDARAMVGYVGQEVFLFDGTIRENVCFGLEHVHEDDLEAAMAIACVDEILALRQADASMAVGPRGNALSGGQRKRVALARALLHHPQILIIDQLASDLESALNARIFEQLSAHTSLSVLYLGHRLPEGFVPDRVYRLEQGILNIL